MAKSEKVTFLNDEGVSQRILSVLCQVSLPEHVVIKFFDNIDKIFLSVLTRYPSSEEKSMAQSGMRARTNRDMSEQQKLEVEADAIGNVIWALVNTREFLFVQ